MDRGTIPGWMIASFLAETNNLAKPQTMRRGFLARFLDLKRAPATKGAEADRKLRLEVGKMDSVLRMALPGAGIAYEAMPGTSNGFFQLQKLKHVAPSLSLPWQLQRAPP
jgi:hypothetical protein